MHRSLFIFLSLLAISLTGCSTADKKTVPTASAFAQSGGAIAYFAGGCFWCVESDFEHVEGVTEVVSGYTGGDLHQPTYENHGDHAEAVEVRYDPSKVSYEQLVHTFWRTVDPFAVDRQFCDSGRSYRSAIFYSNEEEKGIAEAAKTAVEQRFKKSVATEVVALKEFWPAEEYHQDYYKQNGLRYKYYRNACGRDARVREIWGDEAGGLSSHYQ
ncbi:MAG: peptide-methionine (S)-S-oxide reductase MsrA [Verrucomicrobiae bacterium]|nr:peptide-methionine (S)-S-oxide reductase MsrA [Verrucomicrobiae bacterium]